MTDWTPNPDVLLAHSHDTDRYLALLETAGSQRPAGARLSLCLSEADRHMAHWLLALHRIDLTLPWLVLHPGVSDEKSGYSARYVAEAAQTLIREHGYQLILTGSAAERSFADAVAQHLTGRVVNLTGQLALGPLTALLAEAPLLLTSNRGPVHMAAALQTPVVVMAVDATTVPTPLPQPLPVATDVPSSSHTRHTVRQSLPPGVPLQRLVDAVLALVTSQKSVVC
ncbi:glycosyl transferase family protein [Fibrella aestuarina BUZ 2]|uniref:Glycosyl transferase family protein n=1 Tax=Fibrella aestuarina BUZ 2 TaxID=1166018 RepID=I0KC18_9BACT|nr:glycosyltransferase family 9 protein [Fibrella aestuarina]CCH01671.1 glycosyl transferase family protein [Fibrella aestuarina BUZ 2]